MGTGIKFQCQTFTSLILSSERVPQPQPPPQYSYPRYLTAYRPQAIKHFAAALSWMHWRSPGGHADQAVQIPSGLGWWDDTGGRCSLARDTEAQSNQGRCKLQPIDCTLTSLVASPYMDGWTFGDPISHSSRGLGPWVASSCCVSLALLSLLRLIFSGHSTIFVGWWQCT